MTHSETASSTATSSPASPASPASPLATSSASATSATPTRRLGATGPSVSALGLGCMGMSALYGEADRAESLATIHAALDAGVTLLDTGDFYGMGHNELLIGEALRRAPTGVRERALVSVKFGALRTPEGAFVGYDGRPAAVKSFAAYSLQRLGTDHIDIYRIARADPDVPIEETVGAIAELVESGHVRHIGLSEVGADTIRRAAATAPIADLQIEYSLVSRDIEREILPTLRELGIGVTAYGVLSRGLISGHWTPDRRLSPTDFRGMSPRFSPENLQHNLSLVETLREMADDKGVTVAQLAIAWVLAQGEDIVPLVGARTRQRLAESLAAPGVSLDTDELAAIGKALPPGSIAGERYPAAQMRHLDSEK
ncbi:aldo/keto reductase [Streptomyces radicis]|uniref:Aldo/keto reductase n=2 Tax=Streptomyces radicis TaxID=1750517 RepID=A0A3A9WVV7_9ACTN|nr:aldo/keto reductase [Streptomyces radicis]RKN26003.1 aldo/keto reductase [Streptomyces radicis]